MTLWNGYRDQDIRFLFRRIAAPGFAIEVEWTLSQLIDYMMTWSAFKRSRTVAQVARAMDALFDAARSLVPAETRLPVRMPLKIVPGRIP